MSADLLSRDALAERAGSVWDYVSPSRLNLWLRCPLAFRLRYVDGIKSPSSPALFVGKMVHAGLESYYRRRQLGLVVEAAELAGELNEGWGPAAGEEQVKFDSVAEEQASRKQVVELVSAYLAQVPADEPRPLAIEVAAEAPLVDPASGENLGLPLVGIMDLLLPDPAGPLICDFKTAARGGEPLAIVHEIQLSCYSYLFRHSAHEPESGLEIRQLIKTKLPRIETHRYPARDERHYRRLFSAIRAYLDDRDRKRYVFRPGLGCGMCDFRDHSCRAWDG